MELKRLGYKLPEKEPMAPFNHPPDEWATDDPAEYDIVSSATTIPGIHLPLFDFDFHVFVHESSPGKHHVYLDIPTKTEDYRKVLAAMVEAGWIQEAWAQRLGYRHSRATWGDTLLRLAHVPKDTLKAFLGGY